MIWHEVELIDGVWHRRVQGGDWEKLSVVQRIHVQTLRRGGRNAQVSERAHIVSDWSWG